MLKFLERIFLQQIVHKSMTRVCKNVSALVADIYCDVYVCACGILDRKNKIQFQQCFPELNHVDRYQ